ncbi:hypothetical protein CRG98_017072 [Punica granatum]|uniref:AP2/ERF domain-containing protein n=1 Tax=Punica granatum TaxID=22663 RepID=A0A2I0K1W1_PUNGR|nr:hypothetical protein CRG98_017072 [Punica granatum]
MAPPATNWLSFSLSPMESLTTSSPPLATASAASHLLPFDHLASAPQLLFDNNFYAHGLNNFANKPQILFPEPSVHDHHQFPNPTIPKLEDFFGDSQTETQDSSSLTHIYEPTGPAYFSDQTDLKAIAGAFQSFSANSGSEVDDSGSMSRASQAPHQLADFACHTVDSGGHEMGGFSSAAPTAVPLSLAVADTAKNTAISTDSDCSKKVADTFGQRTSIYRGVTRSAAISVPVWLVLLSLFSILGSTSGVPPPFCIQSETALLTRPIPQRRQLGGYDKEDKAARAYDLAALKYWGPTATTNFPVSSYTKELEEMKHVTKQEFIASLRRHHQQGRWQARIGRVAGNKDLYLGTFATEEEAAEAYDIAAIKFRGVNAVTNFEMNRYDVEAISNSTLPIGGAAKRLKLTLETDQKPPALAHLDHHHQGPQANVSTNINFGAFQHHTIPGIPFEAGPLYSSSNFHQLQSNMGIPCSSIPSFMVPQAGEFFLWPNQNC